MSRTNTPDRVLSRFKPSAPSAASHAIVEDTCPSVAAPVFLPRFLSIFPVIMPRNDQVTRQWHVLQRLEGSKHGLTLDELLTALPTDLAKHPRTIRRDLESAGSRALSLTLGACRGSGPLAASGRFRNVPALGLSPTELMALAFTRQLVTPLEGTEIKAALDSALRKATARIPPSAMQLVQQLEGTFSVGIGPHKRYRHHRETIDRLTHAITGKTTVQMRY